MQWSIISALVGCEKDEILMKHFSCLRQGFGAVFYVVMLDIMSSDFWHCFSFSLSLIFFSSQ